MQKNFRFFCIFGEYSVFWHWTYYIKCGYYYKAFLYRKELYFNYLTLFLTSKN